MAVLSPVKGSVANRGSRGSVREAVVAAAAGMARRGETEGVIGGAVRAVLRAGGNAVELGAAYETLLGVEPRVLGGAVEFKSSSSRKARGAFYTPSWLVEVVLDSALRPLIEGAGEEAILRMRVLDPACGAGAFLIGAGDRLAERLARIRGGTIAARSKARRQVAARCLFGIDRDDVAVELCRAAIRERFGANPGSRVVQGNGLLDPLPGKEGFDVVVGNPPFLNRLERLTEVDRDTAKAFKEQFGAAARAYTDVAALFLLRAVQATRPGGRVAMVQPQSVLGSRDAAGVRAAVEAAGVLTDVWLAEGHAFDASVFVCVPTIEVVGRGQRNGSIAVQRSVGADRRRIASLKPEAGNWAALAAVDVPTVRIRTSGAFADVADVTADFRDEYYGLRGTVVEHRRGLSATRHPALVSTGLIDPGVCRWGEASCRFAGQAWESPRVDLSRLEPKLRTWASRRLVPKVLLATQTRVLEAAVDERGEWLPVTPLISIVPRTRPRLWELGAALSSPVLSAMGARLGAGTGLSRGAIKLSATQVRGLPMPAGSLAEAARLFRSASRAGEGKRPDLLIRCAQESCAAYGVAKRDAPGLIEWWRERAFG